MATCKKCGCKITWDWNRDSYRCNDAMAKEVDLVNPDDCNESRITIYQCCCGEIIGALLVDEDGAKVHDIKEFADIAWDTDENAAR